MVVQWGRFAKKSSITIPRSVRVDHIPHPHAQLTSFGMIREHIQELGASYHAMFRFMKFKNGNANTGFFANEAHFLPQCQHPKSAGYIEWKARLPQCREPNSAEYIE